MTLFSQQNPQLAGQVLFRSDVFAGFFQKLHVFRALDTCICNHLFKIII